MLVDCNHAWCHFLKLSLLSLFIIPHCFFRVRPPSGDSQAKVCELWNTAESLSGADHLPVLSGSGHNARHLQSRDIRVAHVPCVCVLRVRRVLSKPLNLVNPPLSQSKMAHIQRVNRQTVMFNFCLADYCWDAAWFHSLWTTLRMPITRALAADVSSMSTGKHAVNDP